VGTCDLRTLWSPPVSLNQERHTQRRKAAILFLFYLFFVTKIRWKVPHENIHGEGSILEKFQKKKLNRHISRRGKKKSFEIVTFWGEKKTGFEIAKICGGFGQIPSFLLLKCVYEGCANPNPLTPKDDDRTDRHLKYYM
jgi:hypothetical protein